MFYTRVASYSTIISCEGKGKRKANIRIFRRNVCNVLLPFAKEDFDGGARVFGCLGVLVGRILQGLV
jgi:hypothetical protein